MKISIENTVQDSVFKKHVLDGVARIVVLISGSGSNLQAVIEAIDARKLEAQIVLVVSNRKAAFGLVRAQAAGIETDYVPLGPYRDAGKSRQQYDVDLAQRIALSQPDLIVLAGWMHIDSGALIDQFGGRIINLHPALPGEFPGAHAIVDAFDAWQRGQITHSGCMVHHVIRELDAGPTIAVRTVAFKTGDTLETFSQRLHVAEHELIVEAIRVVLDGLSQDAKP